MSTKLSVYLLLLYIYASLHSSAQRPSIDYTMVVAKASFLNVQSSLTAWTENNEGINELKTIVGKRTAKFVLGYSQQERPIEAYYFRGTGNKKALVIGGMHGSELSSISIARRLIGELQNDSSNYYDVLVLPSLFPDNAVKAEQAPDQIGSIANIGRYSFDHLPDPNRQMPALGKAYDRNAPYDFEGRLIEKENQLLLEVIQAFMPDRILNIHAIKDVSKAGVFADPRTDANGVALGFAMDSLLAINMALVIQQQGGCVSGNQLNQQPTARYHSDYPAAAIGSVQKRNFFGSNLPNKRGFGVSLGSWATTAIEEGNILRPAIKLITMEFPGCKSPEHYNYMDLQQWSQQEINRYTTSIVQVFLKNNIKE